MAQTNIAVLLEGILASRNTIRAKLVELGLSTNTADLTALATAIASIIDNGAVSVTVREGDTYTIPKGFHNGSGTVSGVGGGGSYNLQSKTITPTKAQQNVTPDDGFFALSDVTVNPIPDAYQDVSPVTAGAADVLSPKIIVNSSGKSIAGTMPNNGAVSITLDIRTTEYTVPKGYHSGNGKVKIVTEILGVTPTKSPQSIVAPNGKVYGQVLVEPIPAKYQDVTPVTAGASDVKSGVKIVDASGNVVDGSMPVYEYESIKLTVDTPSHAVKTGYHDGCWINVKTSTVTATPKKTRQEIKGDDGAFLTKVTMEPIPDAYQDVSGVTATADKVVKGYYIVLANGSKVEGSAANNGALSLKIDGLSSTEVTIPAGFTSGGKVSLTNDIEEALAAI